MSISEQVKELRDCVKKWQEFENIPSSEPFKLLMQAAGTIEALSAKLADMERSAEDCGDGWIQCKDRLPETSEYMEFAPTPYMKRIEIAYMTDTVEYLIGFYDGSKWMDKHHNIIKNVIAWKPFLKLPEDYHEP